MPAISALVPELVRRDEIAAAVAMDRSVFHGSRLVGPSFAGLCIGWWGAASAFFANALSFLALIVALISLPKRPVGTAEEEEQRRSGIMEGFRYVRSNRTILSMIALIARALEQADFSYAAAARLLGVHPNYLHRLIRNLDLKAQLENAARQSKVKT